MDDKTLAARALAAMEGSYSPYSQFRVGAALLCEDGEVFEGANVENLSFGLSVCAERNAAATAVNAGSRRFVKVAIASDGERTVPPCGACRQVLREFCEDLEVILVDADGSWRKFMLAELMPEAFARFPLEPDS